MLYPRSAPPWSLSVWGYPRPCGEESSFAWREEGSLAWEEKGGERKAALGSIAWGEEGSSGSLATVVYVEGGEWGFMSDWEEALLLGDEITEHKIMVG